MLDHKKIIRRQRRIYPNIEAAVRRYHENNKDMKDESARILLSRATEEVEGV